MQLNRLDANLMDTDPFAYMGELVPVAIEALGEVKAAIEFDDTRLMRSACLRLTSIGALAGIVGRKLDAE